MRIFWLISIGIFLFYGCHQHQPQESDPVANDYAQNFQIERNEDFTKLTVFNPWGKAKKISLEYYLVERNRSIPDTLAAQSIIRIPVKRVVCLSTTHIAFLDALEEIEAVRGVSGLRYISNSTLNDRLKREEVVDVGYGQQLNYELIVRLDPDLVMVYGVDSDVTGPVRKLEELGIPAIVIGEYLEESPLGKTEWIKFVGALFQKEKEAGVYFNRTEKEYNRLKSMVEANTRRNHVKVPQVMVGSPYRDSWWVPGGKSYLANLIADAGGDYLGKKNSSHESYIISFENALAWASEADYWINMGNLGSKKEIMASDQRFGKFRVYNQGKIYNNIGRMGIHGGNDFWESGTVNPQRILQDLILIFYPGLVEGELYYYKEIL
ncbi:MAG: ABC transporter substrate-binding protein [Mariniphaga sp.]|nr:ABC transporter substrate-binding protein [Mariniphaga sp.]MDD4226187.1 ABC transporter substrate-binding protein [Mariniphaga sp.]MDD4425406.1 ABC transporter substrate-binding protein [Mariniphaga sp.]